MVMKVELMRLLVLIKVEIFLERGHNLTACFHFQKISLKVNRTILFLSIIGCVVSPQIHLLKPNTLGLRM